MSKTSTASKRKYNEKAYERLAVTVKAGNKDIIKKFAEKQGLSINGYINMLIERDMSNE